MIAPKRLSKEGKEKWKELASHFDLANPLLAETLVQYCDLYALYVRASAELAAAKTIGVGCGNGTESQAPAAKVMMQTQKEMRLIYKLLAPQMKQEATEDFELD